MQCIQENDDQMLGFWSSSAISVLCRLKFWVEFRIIWMTIDHGPLRVGKNYIWIMHWEPHVSIKRKNHREIPLYVCSLMGLVIMSAFPEIIFSFVLFVLCHCSWILNSQYMGWPSLTSPHAPLEYLIWSENKERWSKSWTPSTILLILITFRHCPLLNVFSVLFCPPSSVYIEILICSNLYC